MIGMRKESDGFRGGVSCMLNMNLKETFKKQGGMKLLEQYWKNGSLLTAFGELLLLGKSRTALEILRLSTSLKTKAKLEKC